MRMALGIGLSIALLTATAALAAVPREYAAGNDVIVIACDDGSCPGIGGVMYAAGELLPDAAGETAFSIADDVTTNVGVYYCQDFNDDSLCGDDGTVSGTVESSGYFCGSGTLNDGSVSQNPNWNAAYGVTFFVFGPLNAFKYQCDPGIHGFILA